MGKKFLSPVLPTWSSMKGSPWNITLTGTKVKTKNQYWVVLPFCYLISFGFRVLVLWKRREPSNTGKSLNFFWLFLKIINIYPHTKSWLLSPNLIFPEWNKGLVQEGECTSAHSYPLFVFWKFIFCDVLEVVIIHKIV